MNTRAIGLSIEGRISKLSFRQMLQQRYAILLTTVLFGTIVSQAADGWATALRRLEIAQSQFEKLTNAENLAKVPPGNSTKNATAVIVANQIQSWHAINDVEFKKLSALVSEECGQVWRADDGGFYYARIDGKQFEWAGMSSNGLQNGFTFCNVFWGIVNGNTVQGQWADVPRGAANNSGTLSLSLDYDLFGNLNGIHKLSNTGNFGATRWAPSDYPTPAIPILDAFKQVTKNQVSAQGHESLDDNLGVFKDPVVLIGRIKQAVDANSDVKRYPQLPMICDFPPNGPRIYAEFHAGEPSYALSLSTHHPDYDACFDLSVSKDSPVSTSLFNTLFEGMSSDAANLVKAAIGRNVHCEMIMFGRPTPGDKILLPGWAELDGNSVMVDDKPAGGNIEIDPHNTTSVHSFGGKVFSTGDLVRVTGTMVHDKGHEGVLGEAAIAVNSDEELEIHPVYSIDRSTATSTDNLSGMWVTDDGGTIYLHQINNAIWGLWTRPYHEKGYTTVMQGKINGNFVSITWIDVPVSYSARRDEGSLSLKLSDDRLNLIWNQSSPTAVRVRTWTKFRNANQ